MLVFEHVDFPEAGVQVPAGSVEPGEEADKAALREAWEESGIPGLRVSRYIGAFPWFWATRSEEQERHVFQLAASLPLPERWEHSVSAGTEDKGLLFSFYWLDVDTAVRLLSGNQGEYLGYVA